MANLYLTHKCNRGCPFCFARDVLKESGRLDEILTIDEITRFPDFVNVSPKHHLKIEAQFVDAVSRALFWRLIGCCVATSVVSSL